MNFMDDEVVPLRKSTLRFHPSPVPYISLLFASVVMFSTVLVNSHYILEKQITFRIVNTKYGALRGYQITLTNHNLPPVDVYLGIPYASPPTGKLRFMPPVTPASWNRVRNAHNAGMVCPQVLPDISNQTEALQRMTKARYNILKRLLPSLQNQSEDCLYLNIYAPSSASNERGALPVMVFIHGESYEWNSGSVYDGTILSSFGQVIVVTLNYRLGVLALLGRMLMMDGNEMINANIGTGHVFVTRNQMTMERGQQGDLHQLFGSATIGQWIRRAFLVSWPLIGNAQPNMWPQFFMGFFPPLEAASRGNFGLMDQVAALHWIQENIGEFGGSPSNVTIFGHDYGAVLVNLLMLSPMAKGLFQRAIMQSGSALSPFAMAYKPVEHSRLLAKKLDCPSEIGRNQALVECLRKKSTQQLMSVKFQAPTYLTIFGPTVDGIVVPKDPAFLMSEDRSLFGSYDLMAGVTRLESYNLFSEHHQIHGLEIAHKDKMIRTLVRNVYDYHLQEIFLTLSNEYTDWTRPTSHPTSTFESLTDLLGDALVVAPLIRTLNLHSQRSQRSQRSFMYAFLYPSEDGDYPSKLVGCVSGQELNYIFGAPLLSGKQLSFFTNKYSTSEASLSQSVINHWTNFARIGEPTDGSSSDSEKSSSRSTHVEKISWPRYEPQQQQYLAINTDMKPKLRDHYHAHRISYWLNLIPKLNFPGSSSLFNLEHHLLLNYHDMTTYHGIVRPLTSGQQRASSHNDSGGSSVIVHNNLASHEGSSRINESQSSSHHGSITMSDALSENINTTNYRPSALDSSVQSGHKGNSTVSLFGHSVTYSTALSLTVAIGCSLLMLNVLVFAGVFFHNDRRKMKRRQDQRPETGNFSDPNQQHEDSTEWRLSSSSQDPDRLAYYGKDTSFLCYTENLMPSSISNPSDVMHEDPKMGIQGGGLVGTRLELATWIDHPQYPHQQQSATLQSMDNYQSSILNSCLASNIDLLQHQTSMSGHHTLNKSSTYGFSDPPSSGTPLCPAKDEKGFNCVDIGNNTKLMLMNHRQSLTASGQVKSMPSETGI